jgi:hypothetical protein
MVTTVEMVGYKIVGASGESLVPVGDVVCYVVGQTHSLEAGAVVVPCVSGLHFCPRPLDCLLFYDLRSGRRLLRVVVPVGATVATDDGGVKYAASDLRVDADVTADADALLTGIVSNAGRLLNDGSKTATYRRGVMHNEADDGPACVYKSTTAVEKSWYRDGQFCNGCLGRYCRVSQWTGDRIIRAFTWADADLRQVLVDPSDKAAIAAALDRVEPFENQQQQ